MAPGPSASSLRLHGEEHKRFSGVPRACEDEDSCQNFAEGRLWNQIRDWTNYACSNLGPSPERSEFEAS
jgi:hypothetical protein